MQMTQRPPTTLSTKPDLAEAARRWQAYFAGDIIDRPIVCVTARRDGRAVPALPDYRRRTFGDLDAIIDDVLARVEATYWGGEAVPDYFFSFGPDEIAVLCGAELRWAEGSGDTNWSVPCVSDWAEALPIRLQTTHPLWQRMLAFHRRAAERMEGKCLCSPPDLHSNMDLLSGMRGPQQLCLDLMDRPETIDRAMVSARAVFPELWHGIVEAGRMDERGYSHGFYSTTGHAVLQCDFSALIGPTMFRRWVLPALEEEAEIVGHAFYHWDGPDAVKHLPDLCASKGLHTLAYVPGDGRGRFPDYIDLFNRVQSGGKAVAVYGTPDELKVMHKELRPEKTMYGTTAASVDEADEVLGWFVTNT